MKTRISFVIVIFLITNQLYAQKLTAFKNAKGLFGYMDSKTKSTVIEPIYSDAHGFSYGYAAVKKNGKWFYIDKSGKSICDKTFEKAGNFSDSGTATVSLNGDWGTLYSNCEMFKASGTAKTILQETYLQDEKLGWSIYENDGYAEMIEGIDWGGSKTEIPKPVYQKKYHPNGKLSSEENEINGKRDGEWKFYTDDGILFEGSTWYEGKANGLYASFYHFKNKTNLYESGTFLGGKKDGEITYYYPNNKKSFVEIWYDGKFEKMTSMFDENGKLISSNGTGKMKTYFPSGKLKYECEYIKGFRTGVGTWYYDNGLVMQKVLFKYDADKMSSLRWEIFETNTYKGKPLEKGSLKNGNGTIINYDKNDKPISVITYIEGRAHKKEDL